MKAKNPFASNPFSGLNGTPPKLVPVPEAPETHEVRKPMRSYLSQGAGGLSFDGLLGPPGKGPKTITKVKTEFREAPQDEDGLSPPRYG
jgi:hypothetical protein